MFDEVELPLPDEMGELDDAALVDVMVAAALVEEAVMACRLAALCELSARQLRATAGTGPMPGRPHAALERPSRRRRRRRRKRKHRR
jgi:hypothetical protein